ncbi:MAG: hypothetical protein JO257_11560 [Deltaproteobacteria bacterium]|nr:hypothetical protein [Deltaproteobacteria bacterium]
MTARTERLVFWGAVVAMWAVFEVQAFHTPVLLDDWYQLTWHRHHAFGLASIWEYGHYNYFHFNPRIGDVILMMVNGPRAIHLVATPLVQMAFLPLAFAVIFARWPRPTLRDLSLLVILQTLVWLAMPIPGIVYFYRPFATNYLWAFTTMLGLFAVYRLELARPAGAQRWWLVPLMLPLGWVAGMGNEHTGPTAMIAMAALVWWAWKQKRLRAWMVSGLVGLYIGYPMLFFAPGQHLRYAGMATKASPIKLLAERGLSGTGGITIDFLAEAQLALDVVLVAVLIGLARGGLRELPRKTVVAASAFLAAALGMVGTLFASPTVGERLFFAPVVLFCAALVLFADWLLETPAARRFLVIACTLLFAWQVERMVQVLAEGYAENAHRLSLLAAAPANSVAVIPPYDKYKRSRWWWGDDLQYASLREYVANEVYDLSGIEYDQHLHWSEPTPHDHFVATRTFDPPLSPAEDQKLAPRYIPTFWEWALVQLRRSIAMGPIGDVAGHRLVHYVVDMADSPFADPKHRPIRVLDWTPAALTFIDGRMFDDPNGQPYVRIWAPSMPAGPTDAYVEACGETRQVRLQDDVFDHIGPMIPIDFVCRGTYTTFVCQPDVCWFAGRYWR